MYSFFTCTHLTDTYAAISLRGPADPAAAQGRSRLSSQESRAGEQHEGKHNHRGAGGCTQCSPHNFCKTCTARPGLDHLGSSTVQSVNDLFTCFKTTSPSKYLKSTCHRLTEHEVFYKNSAKNLTRMPIFCAFKIILAHTCFFI